ncbi:MAG TPA: PDGLE domain-containing protein [Acidimicrobiales bacterium]
MTRRKRILGFVAAGLLVAFVAAGVVSWFASSSPDGLERVAADQGFATTEREHRFAGTPFADYSTQGVDDDRLSGSVAGVVGVALAFGVSCGAVLMLRKLRKPAARAAGVADR